jgi:hypothetical protein
LFLCTPSSGRLLWNRLLSESNLLQLQLEQRIARGPSVHIIYALLLGEPYIFYWWATFPVAETAGSVEASWNNKSMSVGVVEYGRSARLAEQFRAFN